MTIGGTGPLMRLVQDGHSVYSVSPSVASFHSLLFFLDRDGEIIGRDRQLDLLAKIAVQGIILMDCARGQRSSARERRHLTEMFMAAVKMVDQGGGWSEWRQDGFLWVWTTGNSRNSTVDLHAILSTP